MCASSSQQSEVDKSTHASRLAQVNIFETCLIVTVLFFVCWITAEVGLFLYIVGYYKHLSNIHYMVGRMLILLNSCLNPYVYTLRYQDFKKQLGILLGQKQRPDRFAKSVTNSTYIK